MVLHLSGKCRTVRENVYRTVMENVEQFWKMLELPGEKSVSRLGRKAEQSDAL